ncbi:hypothetical protein [Dyella japonica]|uniref:Uncharacterized protein n=1 Tax=Dyella japonica DSM 16301 TaxID=1440762 RepID=A0A0G9HCJ1_9GAMM|nr:hypothetical protein [Dyella japonica]KLD65422.1 hypothetical protein Y882_02555 [Dyella japonica DSM 16301]
MANYTLPPGNKVGFSFSTGSYVAPAGNKVALRFGGLPGTLFAVGADTSVFGTARLQNSTAQLFPVGFDSGVVNGNLLVTKSVMPSGIAAGAFGTTRLYNLTQVITGIGRDTLVGFGTAWVSWGTRRLGTVGLGDQSKFGTATLAGGVRWLDVAGRGIAATGYGSATVWFTVRELFPSWFIATLYGKPQVDFNHSVLPPGFGGEQVGQAELYRPRFIADLAGLGIAGTGWGASRVDLHTQYAAPSGWLGGGATGPEQFGSTTTYNLLQIVQQQFEVTPSDGGVFGDFNYVDNRNKTTRPDPIQPGKVGTLTIYNNARIVSTPAYIDFSLWGDTLVAYAIREVRPAGSDMVAWGSPLGLIVYNGARVLAPNGIGAGSAGTPARVWSNQQTLKLQGFDMSLSGRGMVSFAIRTVGPYSLPDPPPFGDARPQLWQRYLLPPAIATAGLGNATLEIHHTIVMPSSALPPSNAFGVGRVSNKTPQLYAFGWTATQWGSAAAHNQFERYAVEGWDSSVFGQQVVKDRRQGIIPGGILAFVLLNKHQVRNVLPDPPAPQNVSPGGWLSDFEGKPLVYTNVLQPSGPDTASYGTAQLVSNGIVPRGITPPYTDNGTQFGVPGFNGTPVIIPAGIVAGDGAPTLPDVGPRYVWAPRGYPYSSGFWGEQGEQMDRRIYGDSHPERPVFGVATIDFRNRTIAISGAGFTGVGQPSIGLNPQFIRMQGTSLQRFGFPVLNGGGGLGGYGFDMSSFGNAILIIPDYGPKTVKPPGIGAGAFGLVDVENFNRTLLARGWDSFTISPPAAPSWPRTSHWISNAYAPFPAQGSDHASYGTPWVSLYRRTLFPSGWDSMVLDAAPGYFKDRMRVTKRRAVAAVGIGPGGIGGAWISNFAQRVAPAGFWLRVFGLVNVRRQNRINAIGFDALTLGDVQRWEAGVVKAYGDDVAALGRAVIHRSLRPDPVVGAVGSPRVAQAVGPTGIGAAVIADPVAVARWCGNKAMAVQGFDAGTIGREVVVHET